MRIGFVLGHELPFPPSGGGGVNSLLHSLTRAIAEIGHEVIAYSPTFCDGPLDEVADGVRHIRIAGAQRRANNLHNFAVGLPYVLRVRSCLKTCDILSCHLLSTFLLKPHPSVGIVTHTVHRDPKHFLMLFRHVDRIYTGSEAVSAQVSQIVPSLKRKVKTIHNCVDFSSYAAKPAVRRPSVKFLYVGRFTRDKGLKTLLQAFLSVAQDHPRISLETVGPQTKEMGGDPTFLVEQRAIVSQLGLAERIKFHPPIFDRARLDAEIREADVVCLPSLGGETLNMSILECMRLSKPLIISDLPANRPLIADGKNGFMARAGDPGDWERAMRAMLSLAPEEFSEMGRRSFIFGANRFSSRSIAREYIADFDRLLREKG